MGPLPPGISGIPPFILLVLAVWSLVWKGLALWHAAKVNQRNWFVALLVINSVGILEISYLFGFAKNRKKLSFKIG